MKHTITARFKDSETAQSVCIYLSALYNAQYDITTVQDDSYYSFSAIIPTNIPGLIISAESSALYFPKILQ